MNIVLKLAPVGQENLINSRKAFGKNNGYVLKLDYDHPTFRINNPC